MFFIIWHIKYSEKSIRKSQYSSYIVFKNVLLSQRIVQDNIGSEILAQEFLNTH